jgi:uncharacterized protein (TIGR02246 family)
MKMISKSLIVAAFLANLVSPAVSQPKPNPAQDSVVALLKSTDVAWDSKDGRTMSALFTVDGSFGMPGMDVLVGREALESLFEGSFADRPSGLRHITRLVHFEQPSPDTALADADVAIEERDASGKWKAVKRFHSVYVATQTAREWKLRSMRSFPAE